MAEAKINGQILELARLPDGTVVKKTTDGYLTISTVFKPSALSDGFQKYEDEPNWRDALLILKQFRILFQCTPKEPFGEYMLVVDKFSVWDLQEGFGLKYDLINCMWVPEIRALAADERKKITEESQDRRGELDHLLDIMTACSQSQTQDDQFEAHDDKLISDSLMEKLREPFTSKEIVIPASQWKILESLEEWQSDYTPLSSSKSTCSNNEQLVQIMSMHTAVKPASASSSNSLAAAASVDVRPGTSIQIDNANQCVLPGTSAQYNTEPETSEQYDSSSHSFSQSQVDVAAWQDNVESVRFSDESLETCIDLRLSSSTKTDSLSSVKNASSLQSDVSDTIQKVCTAQDPKPAADKKDEEAAQPLGKKTISQSPILIHSKESGQDKVVVPRDQNNSITVNSSNESLDFGSPLAVSTQRYSTRSVTRRQRSERIKNKTSTPKVAVAQNKKHRKEESSHGIDSSIDVIEESEASPIVISSNSADSESLLSKHCNKVLHLLNKQESFMRKIDLKRCKQPVLSISKQGKENTTNIDSVLNDTSLLQKCENSVTCSNTNAVFQNSADQSSHPVESSSDSFVSPSPEACISATGRILANSDRKTDITNTSDKLLAIMNSKSDNEENSTVTVEKVVESSRTMSSTSLECVVGSSAELEVSLSQTGNTNELDQGITHTVQDVKCVANRSRIKDGPKERNSESNNFEKGNCKSTDMHQLTVVSEAAVKKSGIRFIGVCVQRPPKEVCVQSPLNLKSRSVIVPDNTDQEKNSFEDIDVQDRKEVQDRTECGTATYDNNADGGVEAMQKKMSPKITLQIYGFLNTKDREHDIQDIPNLDLPNVDMGERDGSTSLDRIVCTGTPSSEDPPISCEKSAEKSASSANSAEVYVTGETLMEQLDVSDQPSEAVQIVTVEDGTQPFEVCPIGTEQLDDSASPTQPFEVCPIGVEQLDDSAQSNKADQLVTLEDGTQPFEVCPMGTQAFSPDLCNTLRHSSSSSEEFIFTTPDRVEHTATFPANDTPDNKTQMEEEFSESPSLLIRMKDNTREFLGNDSYTATRLTGICVTGQKENVLAKNIIENEESTSAYRAESDNGAQSKDKHTTTYFSVKSMSSRKRQFDHISDLTSDENSSKRLKRYTDTDNGDRTVPSKFRLSDNKDVLESQESDVTYSNSNSLTRIKDKAQSNSGERHTVTDLIADNALTTPVKDKQDIIPIEINSSQDTNESTDIEDTDSTSLTNRPGNCREKCNRWKWENLKVYEPKKISIDGHCFGSRVHWKNFMESPYQKHMSEPKQNTMKLRSSQRSIDSDSPEMTRDNLENKEKYQGNLRYKYTSKGGRFVRIDNSKEDSGNKDQTDDSQNEPSGVKDQTQEHYDCLNSQSSSDLEDFITSQEIKARTITSQAETSTKKTNQAPVVGDEPKSISISSDENDENMMEVDEVDKRNLSKMYLKRFLSSLVINAETKVGKRLHMCKVELQRDLERDPK